MQKGAVGQGRRKEPLAMAPVTRTQNFRPSLTCTRMRKDMPWRVCVSEWLSRGKEKKREKRRLACLQSSYLFIVPSDSV